MFRDKFVFSEDENGLKKVKTFCGRICGGNCGILVTLEEGLIKKVEADPDCPLNEGYICPKGRAIPELIYHPNRIKHPLKRIGNRGEGQWEQISTQEAISSITKKLKEYSNHFGSESILLYTGAYRGLERYFVQRFATVIGTPNTVSTDNVCHAPRTMASRYTLGARPSPDYEFPPKCIIIWGSNSLQTGSDGTPFQFKRALEKGTKLIIIDPRKISLASNAAIWIKPRPGSDGLLALGIMKAIIEEGLYDKNFVSKWTVGFDKLEELVAEYKLEEIAERTWVPKAQIEQAARLYAMNRPAAIQWGNALDQTSNAFQTCRAILILSAITGNIDVPGGNVFLGSAPTLSISDFSLLKGSSRREKRPIGDQFKIAKEALIVPSQETSKAILNEDPYPLKAALIFGSNPMLTHANSKMVYEGFKKLGFLVVVDFFMTPTTALADIILPAAANLEFDEFIERSYYIAARPKIVDPPGECRSDMMWMSLIAKELGYGNYFWDDEIGGINTILQPSGMTFSQLKDMGLHKIEWDYKKFEKKGFSTPSGKVDIYSERLKQLGLDPLPTYKEPKETPFGSPEKLDDYPLVLTNCKNPFFYHASHRNIDSLRELSKEPVVEVHPSTCAELGINDGDNVHIETPRGRIKQKLRFNPDLDPRVVIVSYGWWFPEKDKMGLYGWAEANINVLTSNDPPLDPAMGSCNLRGLMCRIKKAG